MREIKSASKRSYGIVISQKIGEMPAYLDVLERRFSDALNAWAARPYQHSTFGPAAAGQRSAV
jgi:hypothetical protein